MRCRFCNHVLEHYEYDFNQHGEVVETGHHYLGNCTGQIEYKDLSEVLDDGDVKEGGVDAAHTEYRDNRLY